MKSSIITAVLLQFLFTTSLNAVILSERKHGDLTTVIKQTTENEATKVRTETTSTSANDIISYAEVWYKGNQTGWNAINSWTNKDYDNLQCAYYVAYDEASLITNNTIDYWQNTVVDFCAGQTDVCKHIKEFVIENNKWIHHMINTHAKKSVYWWQINLVYKSIEGFIKGYSDFKLPTDPEIPEEDFWLMTVRSELYDLVNKFSKPSSPNKYTYENQGSAIVKLLEGNTDLVVGQNAWFGYNTMTRFGKRYEYNFKKGHNSQTLVPATVLSFSGYPSVGHSIDSFYVTSSRLAVQKTSIKNYNDDLWSKVHPRHVVFEFARTLVANRLATDGKSWKKIFERHNSGTSNAQWMVVDYNKFKTGHTPKKGLLWIVEQSPALVKAEDVTSQLTSNSYWASYNIPYNQDIYHRTSHHLMTKKYGPWFSYDKTPRAQISKRDNKNIKCVCTLLRFLRSNDFKHDPLSKCSSCHPGYSAANAIAARLDLNKQDGSYPFSYLARHPGGAIDAKAINSTLLDKVLFLGVSGPTTGTNLPVFQWSKSGYKNIPHMGQVDSWNFAPTVLVQV